ncbi:MAG: exodeoxyribonuclease VII large subunit [Nanoarchaeota archaeon]|jgi:exodeoxyribonuclease VII large subunit|nr:exodeoxyribonuclease VII large subunit [Nanoarchaeota archaeon]
MKSINITNTSIFTVYELNRYIKNKFENDDKLNNLFVKGEISNLVNHSSGHSYFSLKDDKSQLRCVFFRNSKSHFKFDLKNGMKIILEGSLEIYEPRGEYSLVVKDAQPDGLGSLHLAFIQLKEKLEKEGLFSVEHKKPFPKFPKEIGIITSPTGAALQDILKVLRKRYPLVKVRIVPALVQGEDSANSIVEAIKVMNTHQEVDVIILGRGGGSIEDLWSFNEEIVAREIFKSNIPIISAVGHEIDFTISDFVADKRAPTPSAAAEMITPDIQELYSQLNNIKIRSNRSIQNKIELYKSNLKQVNVKSISKKIIDIMNLKRRELDDIKDIIEEIMLNNIKEKRKQLEIINLKIKALNPKSILKRGYGIIMKGNEILTNPSSLKKGEAINIILDSGKIEAEVKNIQNN